MDKFETEKGNGENIEYHRSQDLSSQWPFSSPNLTNTTMGLNNHRVVCKGDVLESSSCSSASMVDSFCAPFWDQSINLQNTIGFRKSNLIAPRIDMTWAPLNPSIPASFSHTMLSQNFSNCPTDSGFIERAARFSSFTVGNFGDMMNPFCIPESVSPPYSRPQEIFGFPCDQFGKNEMVVEGSKNDASPLKNEPKQDVAGGSGNDTDDGGGGGGDEPSPVTVKGQGSKKRKRSGQANENGEEKLGVLKGSVEEDTKEVIQPKGDQNKASGKQVKEVDQGTEAVKEEYIHVRARRGQATNSHSLAERVRREKISERMKFLQDLVPGCSKVTGKAVMLDEIINYVQSLQRQVEFLSMKLATVNPRLEFDIEGRIAKDVIHSRVGPSSSPLGYHGPDMSMPPPPPYHPQPLHLAESSSDSLRRTINSHLTAMNAGFKEPTSQATNVWEDELNNIVQMGFNSGATLDGHD
jgi:hypothetical protein